MSDHEMPEEVPRQEESRGFFSSWYVRIGFGVIGLVALVIVVVFVAYQQAKSDHSQPLEINHYPDMQLISEVQPQPGQSQQYYQLQFDSIGSAQDALEDIEAYYQREMDDCSRLAQTPDDSFHTIVCEKDSSSDRFGFTQLARLRIQAVDGQDGAGYVVVEVNNFWEE